jgi:hypothetical protein
MAGTTQRSHALYYNCHIFFLEILLEWFCFIVGMCRWRRGNIYHVLSLRNCEKEIPVSKETACASGCCMLSNAAQNYRREEIIGAK